MISATSPVLRRRWLDDIRNNFCYIALLGSEPTDMSTSGEVTGEGYSRQVINWSAPENSGIITNTNVLTFRGIHESTRVAAIGVMAKADDREVAFYGVFDAAIVVRRAERGISARSGVGEVVLASRTISFRIA